MLRARNGLLLLCALAFGASCGQTKMVQTTGQMRNLMIQRNYPGALATLRQSKNQGFKEQDRVVFWMNEGMLLFLTGRYVESNAVLDLAEQRIKELFTVNKTKNLKALITSDAAKDYPGEDYEKVLVNVLKAFNYLALRKLDGAMVEARKINEKLALFNTNYEQKSRYNQDAFAHWLTGILFEMEGSFDDARISYGKAMETYQTDFATNYGTGAPKWLAEDLARSALLSGAKEELEKYRKELGPTLGGTAEELKTKGEVILIHLNGEGPTKSDYFVTCVFDKPPAGPQSDLITRALNIRWYCDGEPGGELIKKTTITIPNNERTTVVKVAFPELHVREPVNPAAELIVGAATSPSEIVLPISRIATKALSDKTGRIFKDAVFRVIVKTLSAEAAGAAGQAAGAAAGGALGGSLLGWASKTATSATMQATEEADKRAWITLPSRIEMARVLVPAGMHPASIRLPRGQAVRLPPIKVEAGKRVIVTWMTIP